jgi:hypothetical protein
MALASTLVKLVHGSYCVLVHTKRYSSRRRNISDQPATEDQSDFELAHLCIWDAIIRSWLRFEKSVRCIYMCCNTRIVDSYMYVCYIHERSRTNPSTVRSYVQARLLVR